MANGQTKKKKKGVSRKRRFLTVLFIVLAAILIHAGVATATHLASKGKDTRPEWMITVESVAEDYLFESDEITDLYGMNVTIEYVSMTYDASKNAEVHFLVGGVPYVVSVKSTDDGFVATSYQQESPDEA